MKIQIIGYSGSGKSTLARKLGVFYNIPYLHLDNVNFYGDWQVRSLDEKNRLVNAFLNENPNWVIDGNYSVVSPQRFEESDITIYLAYNRIYCYFKCKKRYKMYKNTSRESCPCKEKFDKEFKKWILYSSRIKKRRMQHKINLNKTKGEKLIFKNVKQLNKWLLSIGYKEED